MFTSAEDAQESLASVGYLTDTVTATVVFLAARLNKSILLEGPPGSGKTELAYAISRAVRTTVERLQCYAGITEEKAIGRFDESLQRLWVDIEARSSAIAWEDIGGQMHTQRFFVPGPLLRAVQSPERCVLLVDELDKVDQGFEAQAFKRAASCFGLGRYLYDIQKEWVDIDDRKRPLYTPKLFEWATPEGWIKGLRPEVPAPIQHSDEPRKSVRNPRRKEQTRRQSQRKNPPSQNVNRILELQPFLIHRLYRGILKDVAQVWNPQDIGDPALEQQVLEKMEEAELSRRRFDRALQLIGQDPFHEILRTLKIRSFQHIDSLETFSGLVRSMEEKAGIWVPPALPPTHE